MKKKLFIISAIVALTLSACSSNNNESGTTNSPTETTTNTTTVESSTEETTSEDTTTKELSTEEFTTEEQILSEMTLEEKIGQLFILRPETLEANPTYEVGGVCMFVDNITSPSQITSYIDTLQTNANTPMFIAVDEEGGLVARIANSDSFNVTRYESMEAIGSTGNPNEAKAVGITIGSYLAEYGFNLDFAPVADVNTNPDNIVIGNRAFGSDPHLVSSMVDAAVEGFNSTGVMCCVKHFPGHGDTTGDTHDGYVSITKNWDELKECELIPFISAIENEVDTIMVAHITTPNITSDNLPASMSYEMVTGKLRNELGYNGVVITDAMEMGAIANHYNSADGAVTAINAGVDIILMPQNFLEAYNGIYEAVTNGEISEDRIDESVLRILRLKRKYGLLE